MWEESEKSEEELELIKERLSFDKLECISCGSIIHKSDMGHCVDGDINEFHVGYGSVHDGSVFMVGICDQCIHDKCSKGSIYYIKDSFGHESMMKELTNKWDNSRRLKIRDNNIDSLI